MLQTLHRLKSPRILSLQQHLSTPTRFMAETLFTQAQKDKIFFPTKPGQDPRPNFFVSFRITDPTLANTIATHVQQILPQGYHRDLVPREKYHVTLHVFYAASEEAVRRAVPVVHDICQRLQGSLNPPPITFQRVFKFNPRGALALIAVNDPQHVLEACRDELRKRLGEIQGIVFTDELRNFERDYNPHVTVVKVDQRTGLNWVPEGNNTLFGSQDFAHIELCQMSSVGVNGRGYRALHNEDLTQQ